MFVCVRFSFAALCVVLMETMDIMFLCAWFRFAALFVLALRYYMLLLYMCFFFFVSNINDIAVCLIQFCGSICCSDGNYGHYVVVCLVSVCGTLSFRFALLYVILVCVVFPFFFSETATNF